jgi:hypothetical protein
MLLKKPISFIEFFDAEDRTTTKRLKAFATLVNNYVERIAKERVPDFRNVDQLLVAEEIKNFTCMVFYKHWVGEDFGTIVDPAFGVSEVLVRGIVCKAYGLQALRDLGQVLEASGRGIGMKIDFS